jgi:hypothetical protein
MRVYGNYNSVGFIAGSKAAQMITKIAAGLFVIAAFAACQTTDLAHRQSLEQRTLARREGNPNFVPNSQAEPPPPAEGPDDAPPGPGRDPNRNPALVPSPLLRYSAASMTP